MSNSNSFTQDFQPKRLTDEQIALLTDKQYESLVLEPDLNSIALRLSIRDDRKWTQADVAKAIKTSLPTARGIMNNNKAGIEFLTLGNAMKFLKREGIASSLYDIGKFFRWVLPEEGDESG